MRRYIRISNLILDAFEILTSFVDFIVRVANLFVSVCIRPDAITAFGCDLNIDCKKYPGTIRNAKISIEYVYMFEYNLNLPKEMCSNFHEKLTNCYIQDDK